MSELIAGSILDSIKKPLGLEVDDDSFDVDLIMAINSVLAILTTQIGIGPEEGFRISGRDDLWSSIYTDKRYSMVEEYVYLKVKLLFDPPTSSSYFNSMQETLNEIEYRFTIVQMIMEQESLNQ